MASWLTLQLDTRAPQLQWGPVTDAVAGETMSVAYLVDEPGVERAEVQLRDGRVLEMVVLPAAFTVELPLDAPEGAATIRAFTKDDVWNEASFELVTVISGEQVGPPPGPPPLSGPPVVQPVLIRTEPSSCGARSHYTTTAVTTSRTRGRARSRYAAPGERLVRPRILRRQRVLTEPDQLLARVSTVDVLHARSATSVTPDRVFRRPEGPDAEDDLFLLGLL